VVEVREIQGVVGEKGSGEMLCAGERLGMGYY
jgi:hypothetical protein